MSATHPNCTVDPRRLQPHQLASHHHQPHEFFANGTDSMYQSSEPVSFSKSDAATTTVLAAELPWGQVPDYSFVSSCDGLPVVQEGFTPCSRALEPHVWTPWTPWTPQSHQGTDLSIWPFGVPEEQTPATPAQRCAYPQVVFTPYSSLKRESEPQSATTEHPSDLYFDEFPQMQAGVGLGIHNGVDAPSLDLQYQKTEPQQFGQNLHPESNSTTQAFEFSSAYHLSMQARTPQLSDHDTLHSSPTAKQGENMSTYLSDAYESLLPHTPAIPSSGRNPKGLKYSESGSIQPSPKTFPCLICEKTFDRKSNLKDHGKTHKKNRKTIICPRARCHKPYGRRADLTRHIKSFHEKRTFECEHCGKVFHRSDILNRHITDTCLPTQKRFRTGVTLSPSPSLGGGAASPDSNTQAKR